MPSKPSTAHENPIPPTSTRSLSRALLRAVRDGCITRVADQLAAGAHPDARDHLGRTALMLAARAGTLEIATILLAAGARHDLPSRKGGMTALMLAVHYRHAALVTMLLNHGANPNQANRVGWTALLDAVNQKTTAPTAVSSGAEADALIETLLARGADPNQANKNGWSPLWAAAFYGDAETARRLLAYGADPNQRGNGGATPLMATAWKGTPDLIRLLLVAGADPLAADDRFRPVLEGFERQRRHDLIAVIDETMALRAMAAARDRLLRGLVPEYARRRLPKTCAAQARAVLASSWRRPSP